MICCITSGFSSQLVPLAETGVGWVIVLVSIIVVVEVQSIEAQLALWDIIGRLGSKLAPAYWDWGLTGAAVNLDFDAILDMLGMPEGCDAGV